MAPPIQYKVYFYALLTFTQITKKCSIKVSLWSINVITGVMFNVKETLERGAHKGLLYAPTHASGFVLFFLIPLHDDFYKMLHIFMALFHSKRTSRSKPIIIMRLDAHSCYDITWQSSHVILFKTDHHSQPS